MVGRNWATSTETGHASPWTTHYPTQSEHTQLLAALREFFLVGGLPEAVLTAREQGITESAAIQRNIAAPESVDFVNEGALAEQFVAQELAASEAGLRKSLRTVKPAGGHHFELISLQLYMASETDRVLKEFLNR